MFLDMLFGTWTRKSSQVETFQIPREHSMIHIIYFMGYLSEICENCPLRKSCLLRVMKSSMKLLMNQYLAFSHGKRGAMGLILIVHSDMITKNGRYLV